MTSLPATPDRQPATRRVGVQPSHHLVPGGARLGAITLQVADLGRSLDFCTRVLGFTVHGRAEGDGRRRANLGLPGGRVLLELREKPGVRPVRSRGRLGLYHFALLLPARADLGRFLRHALTLGIHVGHSDHHVSEAVYLQDPDSLGIEVYCDRPRDAWRFTPEGEIIVVSDALDVEAVIAAAGGTVWQGLPEGTALGHLHFYVGDLAQAARFYHDGLGFPKMAWSYPGALFLGADGYHHHVGLNTWAAGSEPAGDDDARLLTWDLLRPDQAAVDATAGSLERAGFHAERTDAGALASDPWGITVRLRPAALTEEPAV